jgi:glycine/D-amino acid oxidase-like deaminating enzyme
LVVVGAGIVGASVAYHAARAGATVTLVDAGRPGAGVTADSFAWVGASGVRSGPAAGLRATATRSTTDSVGVTERLVAGARTHGARVHLDTPVTAVRRDTAGQIAGAETAAGPLSGATVVLAAGVATAALGAPLGVRVPVEPSPSRLFRLRAPAGLVRTVVNSEDFDLRQVAGDRLIAAADSPERTLAAVRSTSHGAGSVELLGTRLGVRPMPADGEPIVGPVAEVPGLYLAVMHSAVTLAAAVGRLVARELVDGTVESTLSGCRPDRF